MTLSFYNLKTFIAVFFLLSIFLLGLLIVKLNFTSAEEIIFTYIPDQPTLNTELEKLDSQQYASKLDTDQYKFIPTYTYDSKEITQHEYVDPKGNIGYQTFIDTGTELISIGNGVEANSRTYTISGKDYEELKNFNNAGEAGNEILEK